MCFTALGAGAQEGFKGENFDNQSQIIIQDDKEAKRCQATRIAPKWYLTAAHCVRPFCDKECMVVVDMLQGEVYASAVVRHKDGHARVFVPPTYHPGMGKSIRSDIALIFFDPPEEDYFFQVTRTGQELSRAEFNKLLSQSEYADQRAQWNALERSRAKLYTVNNSVSRKLLTPVAVPDLRDETQLVGSGFYYFTALHYYIGPDLGIEKGMSGSGVVVPGGAIVGVVSAALSRGPIVWYNEKDEPAGQINGDYFLFTPISGENAAFIQAKMKSVSSPGPFPYIVPVDGQIAEQTTAKLQEVFGQFKSADEVLAVEEKK